MKKSVEEIKKESIEKITSLVSAFCDSLTEGTKTQKTFININEIDNTWSQLQHETSELYADMVGELISAIPESEIIAQKKRISGTRNKVKNRQVRYSNINNCQRKNNVFTVCFAPCREITT